MKTLKVLLIGSGGREHALAWKLKASPRCGKLYALPGSDGIAQLAEIIPGKPADVGAVVRAAKELGVDLVVVGPEAPLAAGISDALKADKIRTFGPVKAAAQLEASKAFAKDFMKRHGIATAASEVYDAPAAAMDAVAELKLPIVVKADGLAAGKGVRVCPTRQEALSTIKEFMVHRSLGDSGARVVLEECLQGPELTIMAFCDGKSLKVLPPSRDHKRLDDGDQGPNTGGMGALAPVEISEETSRSIQNEILDRVLAGFKAERMDYRGILYCGLMLTKDGPKVLEFNVRFGDPETQAVLPLLETDLIEVMEACAEGNLRSLDLAISRRHAVSIVLASEGYPILPQVGREIAGLDKAQKPDVFVFHAGTQRGPDGWKTAGGRVLNVTGLGTTVEEARNRAYAAAAEIRFEGMHYRRDIAVFHAPLRGKGQNESVTSASRTSPHPSRRKGKEEKRSSAVKGG